MSALSRDLPSTFLVKSYSSTGFVFTGGIQVFGPCVVFPKSILHWNVSKDSFLNVWKNLMSEENILFYQLTKLLLYYSYSVACVLKLRTYIFFEQIFSVL